MKKRLSKSIRNEKGQALAIVLALLAIGALTIVPLLHYTYTGLSASQIYDEKMELSYAAEAGLEDGIWKTDNEDMQEEPYNLAPYVYETVYNYSLPEEINGKSVSIDIKQVWPLAGLEIDAYGTEPVDNLVITGGVVDDLGRFQVRLTYYASEGPLAIKAVAVWLPPGFEYVANSSSGITTHDDIPDNPTEDDWNGGKKLIWDFLDPVEFGDLPEPGAGGGIGGMKPGTELSLRILEFSVTPQGEVAKGGYSWVRTDDIGRYLSWERNIIIYRIDSTATDNTTGKTATAKGYTYVSEGVETDWIDTGGLFTGNYRAVGNTLMLDTDSDYNHIRDTLLDESSSTISNIRGDGEVAFAYLYWAGWHYGQEEDTVCTFKVNPVEIITPNASGNHTGCDPYPPSSPNYECVDEAPPDGDETYVETGYAPEILRPDGNGDLVQFENCYPAPPHWEAVDEEVADDATTHVGSDGAGRTDLFQLTDSGLAPGTGIISVTVYERVRREGWHDDDWRIVIKSGTAFDYSSTFGESSTWVERSYQWTTDPNTGQPWTVAAVDALQVGAYVVSGVDVSQVYIEVSYGGTEVTTTLRPNAAGDETNITYQQLPSGAHWDKVNEETADDFSTYVYTSDTPTPPSNWYDKNWQYRKKITIDYNKVEADLADFPVLISITDSDLRDHAKSDGSDIVFTSSNGTIKFKREIESYDNSSGTLVAWVKADLSSTSDTEIYLYYGKSAASETNDTDTWDTNFKLVTHMRDDPDNLHTKDSTVNNNDGTKTGAGQPAVTTSGQIDGAQYFDGGNDEIDCQNAASLQITGDLTIEAWCNPDDLGEYAGIAGKLVSAGYAGYALVKHNTNYFRFMIASAGSTDSVSSNAAYTDTDWHYVVGRRSGGTSYLYVDGVLQTDTSTHALSDSGGDFRIGRQYSDYNSRWWDGIIDEVRLSDTARSAPWIKTSYNNQSAPSNFYSVGAEELTTGAYERDLYNVSDYSDEAGINRVTVYFRFSGDQVGVDDYTGYARAAIKTNGTVYLGSVESQMGETFVTKSYTWTTNPYTGSPWTWDEIAALQVGIELAGTTTTQAYCTQVYAEVDYSPVETEIDTYNLKDHSQGSGTINSVTVYIRTRATSGTQAAEVVIRTYGTDNFSSYTSLSSTSYTDISATWTTNPYTGLDWTWAEIDALEAGVKHYVQSAGGGSVRTTQVYVYVDYGSSHEEEITADTWWFVQNSTGYAYSSFKDVTSIVYSVCPGGNAIYTVGDVDADTENQLSSAGWSLIIIYSSPSEDSYQFYLWNVLLFAGGNTEGTFIIEGFQAPASAEEVRATITCFITEGDKHLTTETLVFNETSLFEEPPPNPPINPEGNIWNSLSSGLGGEKIDGVDIDTFDVSYPVIKPGDTSANIMFTTEADHWNLIYLFLAFRSDVAVLIPSGTGIYSYGF